MPGFVRGSDTPLDFHWRAPEDAIERLGMSPGRTAADRAARASIIASAILEREGQGRRISYSRRIDWYGEANRYRGTAFTRDRVCRFVDALDDHGYVMNDVALPGAHLHPVEEKRLQSAFWATQRMADALAGIRMEHLGPRVPVVLRGEDGLLTDLPDTRVARRIVREVEARNAALGRIRVSISPTADPADWVRTDHHLRARKVRDGRETWACVRPTPDPYVVRIFGRGRTDRHGRLYGWWQGLPKERRADLLINGELVIEDDFACLHPRLLYAMRGIALAHDPYETGFWPRSAGKLGLNVAINAKSRADAIGALMEKGRETAGDGAPRWPYGRRETARILDAVVERNKPIASDIGSDAGVRLMAIDSRMCLSVLKGCEKAGIAALPVHDSFIAPASRQAEVTAIMGSVMEATFGQLYSTVTRCSDRIFPQMPPRGAAEPLRTSPAEPVETPLPEAVPVPGGVEPTLAPEVRTLPAEPAETPFPEAVPVPGGPVADPLLEVWTLPAEPAETPSPEASLASGGIMTLGPEGRGCLALGGSGGPPSRRAASTRFPPPRTSNLGPGRPALKPPYLGGVSHGPPPDPALRPSLDPGGWSGVALPLPASNIVMPPDRTPPAADPSPVLTGWWQCRTPDVWRIVEPDGTLVKGDPLLLRRRAAQLVTLGHNPFVTDGDAARFRFAKEGTGAVSPP